MEGGINLTHVRSKSDAPFLSRRMVKLTLGNIFPADWFRAFASFFIIKSPPDMRQTSAPFLRTISKYFTANNAICHGPSRNSKKRVNVKYFKYTHELQWILP
jgi:hypothetical protein